MNIFVMALLLFVFNIRTSTQMIGNMCKKIILYLSLIRYNICVSQNIIGLCTYQSSTELSEQLLEMQNSEYSILSIATLTGDFKLVVHSIFTTHKRNYHFCITVCFLKQSSVSIKVNGSRFQNLFCLFKNNLNSHL